MAVGVHLNCSAYSLRNASGFSAPACLSAALSILRWRSCLTIISKCPLFNLASQSYYVADGIAHASRNSAKVCSACRYATALLIKSMLYAISYLLLFAYRYLTYFTIGKTNGIYNEQSQ